MWQDGPGDRSHERDRKRDRSEDRIRGSQGWDRRTESRCIWSQIYLCSGIRAYIIIIIFPHDADWNIFLSVLSLLLCPKMSHKFTVEKSTRNGSGRFLPLFMDLEDENSIRDAIELTYQSFGSLDVLVNNAGILYVSNSQKISLEQFDQMHRINSR